MLHAPDWPVAFAPLAWVGSSSCSLAKICCTSRRLSCCALTAAALRSSAKARVLRRIGPNPSSLGSHHLSQAGSLKS
ncbi:hypothetical protein CC79DRAFT_619774 [Sarocladium strictum]